jgi:hypothetical protein
MKEGTGNKYVLQIVGLQPNLKRFGGKAEEKRPLSEFVI